MRFAVSSLALFAVAGAAAVAKDRAAAPKTTGAAADARNLAMGKRLYREGIGVDGNPVHAVVAGDVSLSGAQVNCASCHGRSGMGGVEGRTIASPVSARFLSAPRMARRRRPAYTDATLARAIAKGTDAGGNLLDRLMPRYHLGAADLKALIAYLRTLSVEPSRGAGEDEIHFATVVAPGAPKAARDAMVAVLDAWFAAKNAGSADRAGRHVKGWPDYYGRWILHVWELDGPAKSWGPQLESRYREQPVFALVSGLGLDEWEPVQRFCEAEEIPCLLPNVDTPPDAEAYYSRYFSRGTILEAQAIVAHLARRPGPQRVVQVFRPSEAALRPVRALAAAAQAAGRDAAIEAVLAPSDRVTWGWLSQRAREHGATALVLWLAPADVAALAQDRDAATGLRLYISSTLLGGDVGAAAALRAPDGFAAHPYAVPGEAERRFTRVSRWLANRGVRPSTELDRRRIEDQTFFALNILSDGVGHLQRNFHGDYLLELIDHFSGFESWSTFYPRLSFGPGQSALSKGCYLVKLDRSAAKPEWVVPG